MWIWARGNGEIKFKFEYLSTSVSIHHWSKLVNFSDAVVSKFIGYRCWDFECTNLQLLDFLQSRDLVVDSMPRKHRRQCRTKWKPWSSLALNAKRFALLIIEYRHVLEPEPEPDASLVSAKQMVNQMISCLLTLGSYCKLLVFLCKKSHNFSDDHKQFPSTCNNI